MKIELCISLFFMKIFSTQIIIYDIMLQGLLQGRAVDFGLIPYSRNTVEDTAAEMPLDSTLKEGILLITGSNRGLGLELTKQFVTHHDPPDNVIATCRNPDTAVELQSLVTRFNNLIVLKLDVNKIDTFPTLVESVDSIVGDNGLNVLINNAGIIYRKANVDDIIYDEYLNVLHTNVVAPVFLTRALLPLIKKASALNADKEMCLKRAAVINMSSLMGSISLTTRGYWGYSESKAALNQASRLLTSNVSMYGILVVNLHPGWVKTDLGGPQAHLTAEESVTNIMEILYNLSEYNNDSFLRFDGEEIPW